MYRTVTASPTAVIGVTDPEAVSQVITGEADPTSSDLRKKSGAESVTVQRRAPLLRVPFTSKVRQDIAQAVKQASLKRQLAGETMFNIPGCFTMPNKKQGLFHTGICTFHQPRGSKPEPPAPDKKAAANTRGEPEHQR